MARFRSFRIQVMRIARVSSHNQWYTLNNIDTRFSEDLNLARVIGQQADFVDTQQFEHIGAEGEVALISRKT